MFKKVQNIIEQQHTTYNVSCLTLLVLNGDLVGRRLRKKASSKSIDVSWVQASFGVRVGKFAAIQRAELTNIFLGFVIQYFSQPHGRQHTWGFEKEETIGTKT